MTSPRTEHRRATRGRSRDARSRQAASRAPNGIERRSRIRPPSRTSSGARRSTDAHPRPGRPLPAVPDPAIDRDVDREVHSRPAMPVLSWPPGRRAGRGSADADAQRGSPAPGLMARRGGEYPAARPHWPESSQPMLRPRPHDDPVLLRVDLFPYEPHAQRVWQPLDNLTAYDAWYVAVAEDLGAPLVTLDARSLAHQDRDATCGCRQDDDQALMQRSWRRARVGRLMRLGRITERHGLESMKPGGVRRASVDRSVEA